MKNGKCQLLKLARSRYIVTIIKSQKGLKLFSSIQISAKNKLEMFFLQYTSIWTNFFLIELRIQGKYA